MNRVQELDDKANELSIKFENLFLVFNFIALGFSLQHGPSHGHTLSWLLILSWMAFLLGGIVSALILIYTPDIIRENSRKLLSEEVLLTYESNPQASFHDRESHEKLDPEAEKKIFHDIIVKSKTKISDWTKQTTWFIIVSRFCTIIGLILSLIFASANYL